MDEPRSEKAEGPRAPRWARVVGWGLASAVLLILLVLWVDRPHTPSIDGPDPVAELFTAEIGGVPQSLLIRGQDRSAPPVLFLHGGPGMPTSFLAHTFQQPLEEHFVVIHWDQRGAGRSWREDLDPDEMRVSRFLEDADEVLDLIMLRVNPRPVILVGHSWGSYLGTLLVRRHPERIRAYVGVGQVVLPGAQAWSHQREWLRGVSMERGDVEALEMLEEGSQQAAQELVFRFGGGVAASDGYWPLIKAALLAPEYTLRDVVNLTKSSSFASRHMRYDVEEGRSLLQAVKAYPVPVWFFAGRRDWVTPWPLVVDFAEQTGAELVWFEGSAHFPFFEEPEAFALELRKVARATGTAHAVTIR